MTDLLAHHCPQCRQSTRHMVFRERMLATVLWCKTCFHVSVQAASEVVPAPRPEAAELPPV